MRKHFLIPIGVLLLSVMFACATNRAVDRGERGIAAATEYKNPETGRLYTDEAEVYKTKFAAAEFKVPDPILGVLELDPSFKFLLTMSKQERAEFRRMALTMTWVRSNPNALFHALRNNPDPVLKLQALPIANWNGLKEPAHDNKGTYIVSRYQDVKDAFAATYVDAADGNKRKHYFTVKNYNKKILGVIGQNFMLSVDDDSALNVREKAIMHELISPATFEKTVRPLVRQLAQQAIRERSVVAVDHDGRKVKRIELVNGVARLAPVRLTGRYFGFTGWGDQATEESSLLRWSRAAQFEMFHNVKNDPDVTRESMEQGKEMQDTIDKIIAKRREQMRRERGEYSDVLTKMISMAESGKAPELTDTRIKTQLAGTLIGNVETSEAAVVQSLEILFQHPEALEAAKKAARDDDMKTLAGYVWDALRFNPVNPFVVRYAERDYSIPARTAKDGRQLPATTIPKGAIVLLATESAMMDPEMYKNPEVIDPNRQDRGEPEYYHLGDPYHRCLGDYVSKIQVPEIVRAVLLLDGVKPIQGVDGYVADKGRMSKVGGLHRALQGFPERFSVEYDASEPAPAFQVIDPEFAYEDYLNDFDRHEFRECLSVNFDPLKHPETTVISIMGSIDNHKHYDYKQALLYCRLNKGFRSCMEAYQTKGNPRGFSKYADSGNHRDAFATCSVKNSLTKTETAFYRKVYFNEPVRQSELSLEQATRKGGWDYEDNLKFYDRYTYRECLMNPKGKDSFPNEKEMLLYARLPIGFRMCMGIPVTKRAGEIEKEELKKLGFVDKHKDDVQAKVKEESVLAARREWFPRCVHGEIDWETGKREGALTADEKYYYEKYILKQ